MAKFGSKSGGGKVATPGITRPPGKFVLGSRPQALRAPGIPRIKPGAANTTQYGKTSAPPVTIGGGDTDSMGGMS